MNNVQENLKVQIEFIELPKYFDGVEIDFLKLKISIVSNQNQEKTTPGNNDNIFLFDCPSEFAKYNKEFKEAISKSDGIFLDSEYNCVKEPEIQSIKQTFNNYDNFNQSFLDPNHDIYQGLCSLKDKCDYAPFPDKKRKLLEDEPCINANCPLFKKVEFLPSKTHKEELFRFYKTLQTKLNFDQIHLTFEFDERKDQEFLYEIEWSKMMGVIQYIIGISEISCSIILSNHFQQNNLRNPNNFEKRSILNHLNTFSILVIYLNNIYKNPYQTDGETPNSAKIIQDMEEFVKISKKNWQILEKNNKEIKTDYLVLPNERELSDKLKKSYHMIVIEGHGPNEENDIQLTPLVNSQISSTKINQEYLIRCLTKVHDLQIICLLMCRSDKLVKQLLAKAELVLACNHLLETSIFSQIEETLHNVITINQNKKIPWALIFQETLLEHMTNSEISNISLRSMKIYQKHNIPLIFKQKTDFVEINERKEIPGDITNQPEIEPISHIKSKNRNWRFWTILGLGGLGAIFLGLSSFFASKPPNVPDMPVTPTTNLDTIIQRDVVSINVDSKKQLGGFIIGKIPIPNKKSYKYYVITIRDSLLTQKSKLKVHFFDKDKTKTINAELFVEKLGNNPQLAIIIFEGDIDIPIPYMEIDDDDNYLFSTVASMNNLNILGYIPSSKPEILIQTNSKIEVKDIERTPNMSAPLRYTSQGKEIDLELNGSPIFRINNTECVLGLHLGKSNDGTYYKGQLMDNIKVSLKNSDDPDLKKISQDIKPCPNSPK
jgi:hypothetical protein